MVSEARVGTVGGCHPALDVGLQYDQQRPSSLELPVSCCVSYFSVNKLQVAWALAVTVTCSVRSSGFVGGGQATIRGHRHKVQRPVESTLANSQCAILFHLEIHRLLLTGRLETSTSKVNSLPKRLNSWYWVDPVAIK